MLAQATAPCSRFFGDTVLLDLFFGKSCKHLQNIPGSSSLLIKFPSEGHLDLKSVVTFINSCRLSSAATSRHAFRPTHQRMVAICQARPSLSCGKYKRHPSGSLGHWHLMLLVLATVESRQMQIPFGDVPLLAAVAFRTLVLLKPLGVIGEDILKNLILKGLQQSLDTQVLELHQQGSGANDILPAFFVLWIAHIQELTVV